MYISNYSIIFHQIRITIPINASGARSFNKPVIYTSSIVYATESRSFLPSLREAYRRFKRAFDYKSVMGSLSTRLIESPSFEEDVFYRRHRVCSCSRESWHGKHKLPSKPLSYLETLSRLNETLDGFNRWPSVRLPPPFSSSSTFLQNWFSLTNPVEDTVRSRVIPLERHGKLEKGTLRFLIGSNCELTFRGWPGKKIYYGL